MSDVDTAIGKAVLTARESFLRRFYVGTQGTLLIAMSVFLLSVSPDAWILAIALTNLAGQAWLMLVTMVPRITFHEVAIRRRNWVGLTKTLPYTTVKEIIQYSNAVKIVTDGSGSITVLGRQVDLEELMSLLQSRTSGAQITQQGHLYTIL